MNLSPAQQRFLADFTRNGYALCPGGYAGAGRDASAFWRTGQSLQKLGLLTRNGQGSGFYLTMRGLAWTVAVLRGEV